MERRDANSVPRAPSNERKLVQTAFVYFVHGMLFSLLLFVEVILILNGDYLWLTLGAIGIILYICVLAWILKQVCEDVLVLIWRSDFVERLNRKYPTLPYSSPISQEARE